MGSPEPSYGTHIQYEGFPIYIQTKSHGIGGTIARQPMGDHIDSLSHYLFVSQQINILRGIRQECPLFPLLFDLVIKVWAAIVRKNKGINGI